MKVAWANVGSNPLLVNEDLKRELKVCNAASGRWVKLLVNEDLKRELKGGILWLVSQATLAVRISKEN